MNLQGAPKVKTGKLKPNYAGNIQTVELMREIASTKAGDPLVRELALNIVRHDGVRSHHYLDEALAIGNYVKNQVRYVRDAHGFEQLTDPVKMIRDMQMGRSQGDCDDMSLLIASLLLSIGHTPYFRMARYRGMGGPFQHIYVVDFEKNGHKGPKRQIVLDAIMKDQPIGFEVPHMSHEDRPSWVQR